MSTCQIYLSVHRRHNRSDIANRATIIQLRKRSSNALIISCLRVNRDALSIGNGACHTRKILTSRKIRRFPFPFFLSAKKSGKEELNDSKFFSKKTSNPMNISVFCLSRRRSIRLGNKKLTNFFLATGVEICFRST